MKSEMDDHRNENGEAGKENVFTIANFEEKDAVHTFEEAIDITGNGPYNYGILATLTIVMLGMGMDMFGFSVVVTGSVCDLEMNHYQTSLVMSIPFAGPILMAYFWGYVSDTRGRKYSLTIALFGAFISSFASAFSPTWKVLAALKLVTTSFSSCAQSVAYALLSESCNNRVRGPYMLFMTSMLMIAPTFYYCIGYFVLGMSFSLNLGFITFTPWRLVSILLTLPLGFGAILLCFHNESPKFLLNVSRHDDALKVLKNIYRRNTRKKGKYVVKRIVLDEVGNVNSKDLSLLKSLWHQTIPLFKTPYILRTLQLFYLTIIIFSTNNSFVMWFPFIVNAFFSNLSSASGDDATQSLCSVMASHNSTTTKQDQVVCTSTLELQTTLSCIGQSVFCTIVNIILSKFASRKKTMLISIFFLCMMSALGTMTFNNNIVSFVMFFGITCIGLCIGFLFSYFIDLYPTSHRGMMACLGVMVARLSALGGTNLVGNFVLTECSTTFYAWTAFIFSGVVIACFLPPDVQKK